MGENCAPKIANVVLYVCKARYIDGLVNHQQVEAEHRHKIPKGFYDIVCLASIDGICINVDMMKLE